MAQFLGDIAFALWTALFAAGLIVWHVGSKESAGLIKAAAAILVGVSIAGAACTGYFWFKYQSSGAFQNAHPMNMHMESMQGTGMSGMMNEKMPMGTMHQGRMQDHDESQLHAPLEGVTGEGGKSAEPDVSEWEEHHNEHSVAY